MPEELMSMSALEQARAVRSGELSALELVEASLGQIERLNGELNAVVTPVAERARAEAERVGAGDERPLAGVPTVIKDLGQLTEGVRTTFGSAASGDFVPTFDTSLVRKLREAGAIVVGKTNTPEFGVLPTTEPQAFGATRNPWDTSRTSGGSSGGTAVAVASGMVAFGHGNDGGGSIRIPASCCGLVGLKPSRGRVPRLSQSWLGAVVEGAVTRTVADAAAILDVLSTPDQLSWYNAPAAARPFRQEVGADAGRLRIALMDHGPGGMPTDPACTAAAQRTARALEALGHAVEPVELPTISEELVEPFNLLVAGSLGEHLDEVDWEQVEPHIAFQHAAANDVPTFQYVHAMKRLERMSRRIVEPWVRDFDVLLTPTMAITPPAVGAVLEASHADPDVPAEPVIATVAFAAFANITGQPAISLPVHWTDDGIPVGAQLVGRPWDEATILRLAGAIEQALPWADRAPALAAG